MRLYPGYALKYFLLYWTNLCRTILNESEIQKVYMKPILMKGTYLCHGENDYGIDVAILENLVLDKPQLDFNQVVPVGTDKIFFNWTVSDWNSPIYYFLSVIHFFLTCHILLF